MYAFFINSALYSILPYVYAAARPKAKRLPLWGQALLHSEHLQALLVGLDHLLDHLAAHGTGLAAGQVAIVAILQVDTHLPWCTHTNLSV